MFSSSEQFSQVARNLFEAQVAAMQAFTHAALDAGVNALELNIDTIKSALAAVTINTRQWMSAGSADQWLFPHASPFHPGQLALALRVSAASPAVPFAGSAPLATQE